MPEVPPTPVTLDVIEKVVEAALGRMFAEHELREQTQLDRRLEELRHEAFPEGKPAPHKDYHQSLIDAAEAQLEAAQAQARFYEAAKGKVVEEGIRGVFDIVKILWKAVLLYAFFRLGFTLPEWVFK